MDKKIILAVDDMSESLTIVKTILEEHYDMRLSKSPKAALELLRNSPVDLILLDIEMPRISGFNFLKYLHRTFPKYFKNIPVMIVTAHASCNFIAQAINLGVKDYILKPIDDTLLLKKIEAVIDSAQLSYPLVLGDAEKEDLTMEDMDALLLDEDPTLKQTFTNLRHACFIHSIQAEGIAIELQKLCSHRSKAISFMLIQIYELICNYEYEKALAKIMKLEERLRI